MELRFRDRVRHDRQEAVVDATMRLLAAKGFDRLRVEDVAADVRIAKGTIYRDFESKDHLVETAMKRSAQRLVRDTRERIDGVRDAAERLLEAVRAVAATLVDRPELAILVERRPLSGPFEDGSSEPCCEIVEAFMRRLVESARRERTLDGRLDPVLSAQALLSLVSVPSWRRLCASDGLVVALETALPATIRGSGR